MPKAGGRGGREANGPSWVPGGFVPLALASISCWRKEPGAGVRGRILGQLEGGGRFEPPVC